jgi:hypothetical protein
MEETTVEQEGAKRGPVPMAKDLRRRERISVVVNIGELERAKAAAAEAGDTLSIWARKILMKAAPEIKEKR